MEQQPIENRSSYVVKAAPVQRVTEYRVIMIPIGLFITLFLVIVTSIFNAVDPDAQAAKHLDAGNEAFRILQYDQAIAEYDEAIRLKPAFGEAYFNRGLAQMAQENYEEAIASFDRAIELMSSSAEAYNKRGLAYSAIDDYEKAIADFSQAIAHGIFLTDGAYYENRAIAYWYMDEYDKAIADYNAAIWIIARHPLNLPFEPEPDQARSIDEAIDERIAEFQFEDELPPIYTRRGLAYLGQGDFDQAFQDLDRAITLQPDLALAFYVRGLAHDTLFEFDEAIEDYQQVITLDNDPDLMIDAELRLEELGVELAKPAF